MKLIRRIAWFALLVVFAYGATVAGAQGATPSAVLNVFAAASLSDAFHDIAHQFEHRHPGMKVRLNLAGSQQLATQIEQGAEADVFASADERWMDYAKEHALVSGESSVFARNRLVVIVPRTNPARINHLQDLAKPGAKLVLGAETVPVGKYSRQVLMNLSSVHGFGGGFPRRVLANLVSEEENVKSVVGKVQLGEADAGIVYRSDVTPSVSRYIHVIAIPDSVNVLAAYPISVVSGTQQESAAEEFVNLVLSPSGQRALAAHGLIPMSPPNP